MHLYTYLGSEGHLVLPLTMHFSRLQTLHQTSERMGLYAAFIGYRVRQGLYTMGNLHYRIT